MTADTIETTLTPNAPLLLATMTYIEEHPEEHDQAIWICGTVACFAGHAVLLDGGVPASEGDGALVEARDDDPPASVHQWRIGPVIPVRSRAIRILGLTGDQATALFHGDNTLDDLRAEVARLVGDWDRLAVVTVKAAANAIDNPDITPSAYADPALDIDTKHLLWTQLKGVIAEWSESGQGYSRVDAAVHKLIGRTA